ncbi:unnamed protein product, partial [Discosporangium mesarthrocarpum]
KVTPVSEWWLFKRPPRAEAAMTVKQAEELMKQQENFFGPLSLANRIIGGKDAAVGVRRKGGGGEGGNLDTEGTQVLKESGVRVGGPDEDEKSPKGGGESEDSGEEAEDLEDNDAGGQDDDFGDEVRSDDEEVANDDANEGGGTLHE